MRPFYYVAEAGGFWVFYEYQEAQRFLRDLREACGVA